MKVTLPASGSYTFSTPQFSQIEDPTLNPAYGDTLSPALTSAHKVSVRGVVSALRAVSLGGRALVTGAVSPSAGHVKGRVTVSARKLGSKSRFRTLAHLKLAGSDGRFAAAVGLKAGRWQIRTSFSDRGTVTGSRARTTTVTVAAAARAHIAPAGGSVSRRGTLTTHVRISPRAVKGAKVSLIVVRLSGRGSPARSTLDTVKVHRGTRAATLRGRLRGSGHWAVLESYRAPGVGTAWTRKVGHVTIKAKPKTKKR